MEPGAGERGLNMRAGGRIAQTLKNNTTSFHCINQYFVVVNFQKILKNIIKNLISNISPSSMAKCEEIKSLPTLSRNPYKFLGESWIDFE